MSALETATLRAVAWFTAIGYPPLFEEAFQELRFPEGAPLPAKEDAHAAFRSLVARGRLVEEGQRFVLPGSEASFAERRARERVFHRKWRRLRRLAWWLALVPSVRFLAVCNTTALGAARDEADIDLFLVVRRGSLWLTRGLLVAVTSVFRRRPGQRRGERDAWCFSFLMDDHDLSLARFRLEPEDPYLGFWVRNLVPLLDDGVGRQLWAAQAWAWQDHPFATAWLPWRALRPRARPFSERFDRWAQAFQRRFGPRALWAAAAKGGTDVVLDPHVCKTHLEDRRQAFRAAYASLCARLAEDP